MLVLSKHHSKTLTLKVAYEVSKFKTYEVILIGLYMIRIKLVSIWDDNEYDGDNGDDDDVDDDINEWYLFPMTIRLPLSLFLFIPVSTSPLQVQIYLWSCGFHPRLVEISPDASTCTFPALP